MIWLALAGLAVAIVAPALTRLRALPRWVPALVGLAALALAGVGAAGAPRVHGATADLAATLSVLAAVFGASPVVRSAFRLARRADIPPRARDADPTATAEPERPPDSPGPLRGGLLIGILERGAVAAAVLSGWPEGIAIALAIKGLARYPELREPEASEQFIIGTFTSVLWALAACGVGRVLIG